MGDIVTLPVEEAAIWVETDATLHEQFEDIPLLTKENYTTWKDKMETYLKNKGVWGYLDGTIREPEDTSTTEYEQWKEKKKVIESIFKTKCGAMTLPYIEELEARLIWSQLVTMYEFTHPTIPGMEMESTHYTWCLPFYRAIVDGDWKTVSQFVSKNKGALTAILTSEWELPLHVAVENRQVNLTKELLKMMSAEDVSKPRKRGRTALHMAASDGNIEMVKAIVEKDETLVMIGAPPYKITPIMLAAFTGNRDSVNYLYPITLRQEAIRKENNPGERGKNLAALLSSLIVGDFYGLALDLQRKYPSIILTEDGEGFTPLHTLSTRPTSFRSSSIRSGAGTLRYYFRNIIYSLLDVHVDTKDARWHIRGDAENSFDSNGHSTQDINGVIPRFWKGLSLCFHRLSQNALKLVPGCKNVYYEKLKHYEAYTLLKGAWSLVPNMDNKLDRNSKTVESIIVNAMGQAIENGIVEFIEEVVRNWPQLLSRYPIFHYAIQNRQEKIFGLIHHLGPIKYDIALTNLKDTSDYMSHLAAKKAPIQRLNQVPGSALQMQRELLWYKEVKSIMIGNHDNFRNNKGQKAKELFTEEHKDLLKEGATWMKDTATQCMVVATLIATIMFAAAFTVPGTNASDNSGEPNSIHGKFPIMFVISNILALCSSVASILMFLAIITSRYAEEDFLQNLPQQLMMGLFFLFISIVGMMVTYMAAILDMLRSNVLWLYFPIIVLASIPVTLYALAELPLFFQLMFATSSSHVFGKSKKV